MFSSIYKVYNYTILPPTLPFKARQTEFSENAFVTQTVSPNWRAIVIVDKILRCWEVLSYHRTIGFDMKICDNTQFKSSKMIWRILFGMYNKIHSQTNTIGMIYRRGGQQFMLESTSRIGHHQYFPHQVMEWAWILLLVPLTCYAMQVRRWSLIRNGSGCGITSSWARDRSKVEYDSMEGAPDFSNLTTW